MKEKQIIVGLDIGTTKVCSIVGMIKKEKSFSDYGVEIVGVGSHPSHGLKKGSVINIDQTIKSITCSLEEAKLMAGLDIENVTIGIAGNHIYSFNSSGVIPIKNGEITSEDVAKVLDAAKAVLIPSDREVLHIIPQEYKVDNTSGIHNPVGMVGTRLEVNVHIVTGSIPLIQNLVKCVELSGVNVDNIVLQPIASSNSVLTDEEKDLGTVIVDIGGGTTDIALWKDGSLLLTKIIPVGGNHFTNDLAIALKIPHKESERIKINHGCVLSEKLNQTAQISAQGLEGTRPREVKLNQIADVLGARAEELFTLIKKVVKEEGLEDDISGGYILTGGGALIKGMGELGEYILERPTKIGYPKPFGGMTKIMQNPQYSTVLGLLQESAKGKLKYDKVNKEEKSDIITRFGQSLKSVFREIF